MKQLLQRLIKAVAYTAAGIVILLAVAVGLFRLFLPRLPEYQEEIKGWASTAIGMQVEFAGMDARWGLRGPELKFYRAELIRPENQARVIAAEEVGVGVSLLRLLGDRTLVIDTITVSETNVEIRRLDDDSWLVQGSPVEELLQLQGDDGAAIKPITVIGQDIEVQLIQPGDERPTFFQVPRIVAQIDAARVAVDADIRPPPALGRQLTIGATQVTTESGKTPWNISVEGDEVDLGGIDEFLPQHLRRFSAGIGDIELSLAIANNRIINASSDFDFVDVAVIGKPSFAIRGRIAVSNDQDGWLVAADDFSIATADGEWPSSKLRVEVSVDEQRDIVILDADADYIDLGDLDVFSPLMSDELQSALNRWRPDGVVRNLDITLSDLDTDSPRYSLQAEIAGAGIAAYEKTPGVRGFTGSVEVDHDGGLLQINSTNALLEMPAWVSESIPADTVDGTIIWRKSGARTTILSDSIAIRNAFFDSQTTIQITIDGDDSPLVDIASTWSIDDLREAKRFIPESMMRPRLFLWLQDALVDGRIPRGATQLNGPLDTFPFDGGEGRLLVEASMRDLVFRYHRLFPIARFSHMDIVLDNMHLYTEKNRSITSGNTTNDARVTIDDLRKPVLEIDAYTTGTLASIREYTSASPISRVFGGQLGRVSVDGDASFELDLTIPLLDWRSFDYKARIQSSDGTLAIAGLKPEFTELVGAVTIEPELIKSESLGASFLGETVSIELHNATPDSPGHRMIATVTGAATGDAIAEAFSLPLAEHLEGRSDYRADVLFPRADTEPPVSLAVLIASDLVGLSIDLPPPFQKAADEQLPLSGELEFGPGGEHIVSRGTAGGEFAWNMNFTKLDDAWDFDRGMLMLGGMPMATPEVRGMHIRGETPLIRFDDWLALSRGENAEINAAERIRSVDLRIQDLYLLGQHLVDHQVKVDRSALDWLVQFDGNELSGSAFVPYDFSADRALVLDMERMILPGDDDDAATKPTPDPRTLPAISLKAREFGLGQRMFGEVVAEFIKTPGGLSADSIVTKDASFDVIGNARWVHDERDPLGSRSALTATLTSSDVEQTMNRLNYQPGIESDDMRVLMDVSWSGGPSMDLFQTLDGEVQVSFASGQLNDVEPGAGRVFGLMSIVALPRRLSLDFRDVFQKGLGFDKVGGTFRLDKGVAYTCDLSLEGPAADIGIIGRTDVANRNYEQTAIVSANFGSTLPVVTALTAGPQAAAAVFLFSQIFKKPLADISQVYYSVSGTWDEPLLESTDAEAFANSGQLAGCLDNTE